MGSMATISEKAPEALEVITGAIQVVEADFSAQDIAYAQSLGAIATGWPHPNNPELTARISSFNIRASLSSSDYFRVVELGVPNDNVVEVEGVSGRSIAYQVKLSDPNTWFRPDGVQVEPEELAPEYNTIALKDIWVAERQDNPLFEPGELERLTAHQILRRCQIFSVAVKHAIDSGR